jgi:hypothetical protein
MQSALENMIERNGSFVVGAVNRSKRNIFKCFLFKIKDSTPGFIKKKVLRYLLSSTLYIIRPDILLALVRAWVISVLVIRKLLLII